jgi:hypothetical protein
MTAMGLNTDWRNPKPERTVHRTPVELAAGELAIQIACPTSGREIRLALADVMRRRDPRCPHVHVLAVSSSAARAKTIAFLTALEGASNLAARHRSN